MPSASVSIQEAIVVVQDQLVKVGPDLEGLDVVQVIKAAAKQASMTATTHACLPCAC